VKSEKRKKRKEGFNLWERKKEKSQKKRWREEKIQREVT